MIQLFLTVWKFKLNFQVWAFDACMNERVVFAFLAGFGESFDTWKRPGSGVSVRWTPWDSSNGALTWSAAWRGKRRAWQLCGPIRRIG